MKSLVGLIVITWPEIVASNPMSVPLMFVSLSVIRASTFASVMAELSVSLTASSKVIVILLELDTDVAPLAGLNVAVGATVSAAVNVAFAALMALSDVSSIVAPTAT